MKLYVHMRERAVTTLGPGCRYVVWVSGCSRSCPGCIAPEAQDMHSGTPVEVGALAWEIILSGADGLTISGGEPFLQAPALAELIAAVRRKRDLGVIVYTGYLYEELPALPGGPELLEQTDLLIDGPYIRELDDGLSLRGSSNQRVLPLTQRYADCLDLYGTKSREQEIFSHGASIHYVGIPTNSRYTKE